MSSGNIFNKGGSPSDPTAHGMQRISVFLARAGIASRRHAEELIRQGRVYVNGHRAVLGEKVCPGVDKVTVDGVAVTSSEPLVYIALHKPPGYISTCSDPFGRPTVLSLLQGVRQRVFPVGRLDMDAEGLLLLTNDGRLAYLLTHPKHQVVKEYLVEVAGEEDESKIRRMLSGIIVDGKKVEVDYARFVSGSRRTQGASKIVIGVHEGEKHLVKRLCAAVGYPVKRLIRVKIGPLSLDGIPAGSWRYLSDGEVNALYTEAQKGGKGEEHVSER